MPNSIASHLTSSLLHWRNPKELESNPEGCMELPQDFTPNKTWHVKQITKAALVEVSLPLVFAIAAIEALVYALLLPLTVFLYPITEKPLQFTANLLSSSAFTLGWTTSLFAWNFFRSTFVDRECLSRAWVGPRFIRASDTREMIRILEQRLEKGPPPKQPKHICWDGLFQELSYACNPFVEFSKSKIVECGLEDFQSKKRLLNQPFVRSLRIAFIFHYGVLEKKAPLPLFFSEILQEQIETLRNTTFAPNAPSFFHTFKEIEQASLEKLTDPNARHLLMELEKIVNSWEQDVKASYEIRPLQKMLETLVSTK